MLMFETCRG